MEKNKELVNKFNMCGLNVIAARPAMGKTTLLLDIAKYYSMNENMVVAIFSLEMSKQSIISKIDELLNEKVIIDDTPGISVEEIKKKCIKLKNNIGMVLIDYLQLVSTDKCIDDREQEISYISGELKNLVQELNVPIIVTSQLSKDIDLREDKIPVLSDLKYSGSLKQIVDVIIFLYRDDYYNQDTENKGEMKIIVAKSSIQKSILLRIVRKLKKRCSKKL